MALPSSFQSTGRELERWGVILAVYPNDVSFATEVRRAPDDGAGGPLEEEIVTLDILPPGVQILVDEPPTSNDPYHYSSRCVREGYTPSEWSSWLPIRPMILPDDIPVVPAEPPCDLDMFVDPVTGEITLYCNGTPRVVKVIWAVSINDGGWPDYLVDGTEAETDDDGDVDVLVPIEDFQATPGDLVKSTVAFVDSMGTVVAVLRRSEAMGLYLYCNPILDEDDGDLYLYPNRGPWSLAVYWKVYEDGDGDPDEADVLATGTLSTADEILVHTFTLDGEVVQVGVVATQGDDGSGAHGPLEVRRYTYHAANDRPYVTWHSFTPDVSGYEGVRLIARDDSATCRLFTRQYTQGETPPSWDDTGLLADPVEVDMEILRPAEGDAPTVVEFYAEDSVGNMSSDVPQQVVVDGNLKPSGSWDAGVDENWAPRIRVSTDDPDTGSWRLSVVKTTNPGTFDGIDYSDAQDEEKSGNTFNGELVTLSSAFDLIEQGYQLNCEIMFYRTLSTVAADQMSSMKSSSQRFTVYRKKDTIIPTFQLVPSQDPVASPGKGVATIKLTDPQGLVDGTAFESYPGDGSTWEPDEDPGNWTQVNEVAPFDGDSYEVDLVEGRNPKILGAIRADLGDGNGPVWLDGKECTFDADLIPKFAGSLAPVGKTVRLQGQGDEDQHSLVYATSKSSMPLTTVGGTLVPDTRVVDVEVESDLAPGETLHVRATAWSGTDGTGIENTEDFRESYTRSSTPPKVKVIPTITPTLGQVDILLDDPASLTVATSFITHSGAGDWSPDEDPSTWPGYKTTPWDLTYSVTKHEKYPSVIWWGVGYDQGDGAGVKWETGPVPVPPNTVPAFVTVQAFLNGAQPRLSWGGDDDLASVGYVLSTVSMPGDMTGQAYSDGVTGLINLGSALTDGQTLYLRVRGYGTAGGTGTETPADYTLELPYTAPGSGDDLNPLAISITYTWKPSLYTAGSMFTLLQHIQVGTSVASIEFIIEDGETGGYTYTLDISQDGDSEVKVAGGATTRYFTTTDAGDPIPIRARAWSGAGGTGTAGQWRRVDAFPAEDSGAGVNIYNHAGLLIAGPNLQLGPELEVTRSGSSEKKLLPRTTFTTGPNETQHDYADGPVQSTNYTGDRTLLTPLNMPDGGSFILKFSGSSSAVDVTLHADLNCLFGVGPYTPYTQGTCILTVMKIGSAFYSSIMIF